MKKLIVVLAGSIFLSMSPAHAEKGEAGPKGGKLLTNEPPRAEFFVEKDHKVSITFYDESLKEVPASTQVVTAVAETKEGKSILEFEKKGNSLVSKSALPHGDGYNVVVQVKKDQTSKPQNFRIKYDTHICGECGKVEYACTCDE